MNTQDETYIRLCIELAETAFKAGDMPFGCVVVKDGKILAQSQNLAHSNGSIFDHAETLAMKKAIDILGTKKLDGCTLYSNFEPCPMCAFMIRELHFKKVVFSIPSLDMGGFSKWQILQDETLQKKFPHHYIEVPEIVSGVLYEEAKKVWQKREALKNPSYR